MIEKIIAYSVRNKLVIGIMIVVLIFWGLYSLGKLSIDAVPDITNNQVQILTTTRNLSTLDVEQFISYPIEMEMANLPGVKEIRSTNKFGLSVVTIVFKEDMGTYLPRQLIAEKIKSAKEKIPEGFGVPEMGPITTGLGEIYQYVIDVKPGYEDKYTNMELRTIQDWIVKRQLSGIDGVVEVNTWGGQLKQYEIAVDPLRLKSMHVSLDELLTAIESNNGVAGAGYIEKNNQSYFIRAEGLLSSLDDINKVVVKVDKNNPILIGDIATVQYGHAPRFGAITGNGQGEKVMGQVMLLKGANTKKVLADIIERVAKIQHSLPEGVFINPFLERSPLLSRTTNTIFENLLLGALIVIFVVILLLGNFRSGLIIASLIPLSLLFAFGMMNVFGVSANLMSLGAIDFGIIIDGGIIIVEYILFSMTRNSGVLSHLQGRAYYEKKDELAIENSSRMMRSAIFGQIIILVVFLPILTLQGVEGKMFIPMAMTFSFALLGAMILCLTYIPMISALLIKPASKKVNLSDKIIHFLQKKYDYFIRIVMKFKKLAILFSFVMFFLALLVFSRMGGEFVPTLDEGDIVIQPMIVSGTSLSKTIELCTTMETMLKDNFVEIDQIISRIGAAEVPTDPMSMEEVDMIITLVPKSEWKNASTKDELIEQIEAELKQLPGMEYEFTQPIEMRFNELISGSRADIAVNIYGEDLDILYRKAVEAKSLIDNIEGAADVAIDKVENTAQVKIAYNRAKVAQYGLSINALNETVQMAYAGLTVGELYKGERRFDIVVRYDKNNRSDIADISQILIQLPDGNQVPISTVADIEIIEAPAKITRDDAKRRVTVGINVRNRDLESVVLDIETALASNLNLPPGYHIKFGGQFENLERAKNRLMLVIPIALLLIFILLYLTFHSIAEAVMIYTAIPLASIGGILLLWFRDMPFSISAGIGFIALFGIAVLNGIVLIEHYKHLSASHFKSIADMVIVGTKERIRPVLITAMAAALGFLPMAISTSSGAEVQRPLATVIIGGLISSTILTLVIVPLLYTWLLEWRSKKSGTKTITKLVMWIPLVFMMQSLTAQESISLQDAIIMAKQNSPGLKARILDNEKNIDLQDVGYQFGVTDFSYDGDALFASNPDQVHQFSIGQTFEHPNWQKKRNEYQNTLSKVSQLKVEVMDKSIELEVKNIYYQLQKTKEVLRAYNETLTQLDYYIDIAKKRKTLGESNPIELMSIETEVANLILMIQDIEWEEKSNLALLKLIIGSEKIRTSEDGITLASVEIDTSTNNLMVQIKRQEIESRKALLSLENAEKLPTFNIGYGLQYYVDDERWRSALELGMSIPLFTKHINKRKEANMANIEIAKSNTNAAIRYNHRQSIILENEMIKNKERIILLEDQIDNRIPEMMRIAQLNYKAGSMKYIELINLIKMNLEYTTAFFNAVIAYNLASAKYSFLKK